MWKRIRFGVVNWFLNYDEKAIIKAGLAHLDVAIDKCEVLDSHEYLDITKEEIGDISTRIWY